MEVWGYCSPAPARPAHHRHGNPSFPWKTEAKHRHTAGINSLLHGWETPGYQDALCKGRAPVMPSLGSWMLIWENSIIFLAELAEKWVTGWAGGAEEAADPVLSKHSLQCLQK